MTFKDELIKEITYNDCYLLEIINSILSNRSEYNCSNVYSKKEIDKVKEHYESLGFTVTLYNLYEDIWSIKVSW